MRTREQLDKWQEQIADQFPNGLTYDDFVKLTLESVDEDGRTYPPFLEKGWLTRQSWIFRMHFDGLLSHRGGYSSPMIPYISEKARQHIAPR